VTYGLTSPANKGYENVTSVTLTVGSNIGLSSKRGNRDRRRSLGIEDGALRGEVGVSIPSGYSRSARNVGVSGGNPTTT